MNAEKEGHSILDGPIRFVIPAQAGIQDMDTCFRRDDKAPLTSGPSRMSSLT